jgi:hypothetical protein
VAELTTNEEEVEEKLDKAEISDIENINDQESITGDDEFSENINDDDEFNDNDDESVCSEDDYDGDIDDDNQEEEINNETCALFLQQLWAAQRGNIQKQKQDRFLPLTKKFVNSSFVKREKMINDTPIVVKHLVFLCRNIANGKIPTDISGVDKALFRYISDKATPRSDVRLHLLEQFAVQYYCKQAVRNIEAVQNIYKDCDGGRCETPVTDRHRAIPHNDEDSGSVSKRQKNSRRSKRNRRRRGTT